MMFYILFMYILELYSKIIFLHLLLLLVDDWFIVMVYKINENKYLI